MAKNAGGQTSTTPGFWSGNWKPNVGSHNFQGFGEVRFVSRTGQTLVFADVAQPERTISISETLALVELSKKTRH